MNAERSREARLDDVLAVVAAGARIAARADEHVAELASSSSLSPELVRRALERNLERDPSPEDLARLIEWAGHEVDEVALVLSAGVFTAPLRALALARAAGRRVTVHPSRRDSRFAELLVRELDTEDVRLAGRFAASAFTGDEVHVYGRDETIERLRAATAPSVRVRSHGHGFGIVWIPRPEWESGSAGAGQLASRAAKVAEDVIDFDQRGCLSPRIVLVETDGASGDHREASHFAHALAEHLERLGPAFPRGPLSVEESTEARRYAETLRFVGALHASSSSLVGIAPEDAPLLVPPVGRHVHVAAVTSLASAAAKLGPLARLVTIVGTDAEDVADGRAADRLTALLGTPGARRSGLGAMQTPPLDGPVDQRSPFFLPRPPASGSVAR